MDVLKIISYFLIASLTTGFVLLSGPFESKLKRNQNHQVIFVWDGKAPPITDINSFRNGEFSDLTDESLMEAIIQLVFEIWSNIPGTAIKLVLADSLTEVSRNTDDDIHSIVLEENSNVSSAAFAIANNSESSNNPKRRYITDCDISIGQNSVSASNLAFILLHEVGHCLGLGHNHLSYSSVMSYASKRETLDLDTDDKLGILYLYPDDEHDDKVKEILPCGTISKNSASTNTILIFWILSLPLLLIPIQGYKKKYK